MQATARDWALLIGLGIIWGAAFMATRIATAEFGALSIAGLRLGLGALALFVVLRMRGEALPPLSERRFWIFAAAVALLSNAAPFTLLGWAQRHIDSGLAGVFMATVPLFVLPLAAIFVPGERLTLRRGIGFALGFAGVLVLIGPDVLKGLGGGGLVALLAQAACLGVAVCYASGSICSKRAAQRALVRFACAALLLAALMTLPLAIALERPFATMPSIGPLAAVIYLGLVPTALATVMLLKVIDGAGPGFLAFVNYMVPLWAVAFGVLAFDETPSPDLGLALVLILSGLAVAQTRIGLRRGGHARG